MLGACFRGLGRDQGVWCIGVNFIIKVTIIRIENNQNNENHNVCSNPNFRGPPVEGVVDHGAIDSVM